MVEDFNALMSLMRKVHSMAAVFPQNQAIDDLFSSTAVFKKQEEALSSARLSKILAAVERVRQQALVDPAVLG
jgi:hypothetical protein